jgi:glutathione S-transferase
MHLDATSGSTDDATPKLWGRGSSSNVQKVIFACEELGQPYLRVPVGGEDGGTDAEAFAALNPNRTVPVWQDGDRVLWESQAILRHLARRHGALYGDGAWGMAAVDQWLDWHATVLWPPIRVLFVGIHRTGTLRWGDPAAEAPTAMVRGALDVLDGALRTRAHVADDAFTLADVAVATGINRLLGMAGPIGTPPATAAWFDRIRARRAFAVAVAGEPALTLAADAL